MITKSALREAIEQGLLDHRLRRDVQGTITNYIISKVELLEDLVVIDDEIAEPLEEEDVMDGYSEEEL